MFTGIVQTTGTVETLRREGAGRKLTIRLPRPFDRPLQKGESIAVSGCCLTVADAAADRSPDWFSAALSRETVERTSFSSLAPGSIVNLERALRVGEPMGGHIVQGHIDGVGTIVSLRPVENGKRAIRSRTRMPESRIGAAGWWLEVSLPAGLLRFVAWKGSIAIEGISLTVASVENDRVGIALVPYTIEQTNLGHVRAGDPVNVEVDTLARYLDRVLAGRQRERRPLTVRELKRQGF
jgi:riboflavin synthase